MAINTLTTATLFMTQLDKIAVQEATTGWMDANAGQVIYNGGSEVKIPKMSVQGMGDYDREAGYQRGSVTLEYETRKMTQDRGRLFQLDPMDINEANFIPTAGAVMGEFQRTQVVPEIDAYRISKLATETLTADKAGMIGESYVPGTASTWDSNSSQNRHPPLITSYENQIRIKKKDRKDISSYPNTFCPGKQSVDCVLCCLMLCFFQGS